MNNADYIIGAYPCAPSFHQLDIEQETEFWRQLADTPHIRGIEQPCLEHLHPYGDEWLLRHTPGEWKIVVTAVMETMRQRAENGGFGLASADEPQRQACLAYYRRLQQKINAINHRQPGKIIALEMQSAPHTCNSSVAQATEAFARSIHEISGWEWSCALVLEHCDAMDKPAPRKGFLPLANELDVIAGLDISLCINWARSAIEERSAKTPLSHTQTVAKAGKLGALMFSGTTLTGDYGEWQDLHAPFAPFCPQSLMTPMHASELLQMAPPTGLLFSGIKLLEINKNASIEHRIEILRHGIQTLLTAEK
ncbi:DUF4862 family protein [Scandinavium manionii]|uniref:DUF4862 family protein n=1 Tax=Scandinavium manionii TaxID=2926520 RepID=UPI002165B292|nr:DUF4862 family protein [Scandinavium manionii]MCS2168002.1 DUF4862 family protein [Scandinavium manionii]